MEHYFVTDIPNLFFKAIWTNKNIWTKTFERFKSCIYNGVNPKWSYDVCEILQPSYYNNYPQEEHSNEIVLPQEEQHPKTHERNL